MIQAIAGLTLIVALFEVSIRLSVRITENLVPKEGECLTLLPAVWVVLSSATLALVTEGLSLLRWLDSPHLFAIWTMTWIVGTVLARKNRFPSFASFWPQDRFEKGVGIAIIGILITTAVIALISAPNNSDSLGYHNARVMHWLVQKSVSHYFTLDDRQLRMPPLASYLRLHAFALCGQDFLFNFTQWIAFALSAALAASISWALSKSRQSAWFCALLVVTIPMAILQSMSSQNDLTAGVFGLVAILFLISMAGASSSGLFFLFWASLGLGALTKGTFYIYGTIIAIAALPRFLKLSIWRWRDLRAVAVICGIVFALGINLPHWVRNHTFFHGRVPQGEVVPLGTWFEGMPTLPLKRSFDQLLRVGALQLDVFKKAPGAKLLVKKSITGIENALGLPGFDPKMHLSDVAGLDYFLAAPIPDEDYAGSALHWLLSLFALGSITFSLLRNKEWQELHTVLAIGVCSAAAISIEIKWMPWNNRLLLPAIVLLTIPITNSLFASRAKRFLPLVSGALLVLTFPYLLMDYSHPVLPRLSSGELPFFMEPRWNNFFRGNSRLRDSVESVAENLPPTCTAQKPVGLVNGGIPEYLLWAGVQHVGRALTFQSVAPGSNRDSYCAYVSLCKESTFCVEKM